jgi:hypothetical protein
MSFPVLKSSGAGRGTSFDLAYDSQTLVKHLPGEYKKREKRSPCGISTVTDEISKMSNYNRTPGDAACSKKELIQNC